MRADTSNPATPGPKDWFSGDVYVRPVHTPEAPSRLAVSMVCFTPGGRTFWHSHALGQTLICTEGTGVVVTRDGTAIELRPGDSVWTPPGEEHWHGAMSSTLMCHYALFEQPDDGTPGTDWLEEVAEADYEAAQLRRPE